MLSDLIRHPAFLRHALLCNAVASGATGLLTWLGADLLAPLLGLPGPLLRGAGLVLVPYAIGVGWLSTAPSPRLVPLVAVTNLLWALASLVLLAGPWVAPTPLGIAFVVVQAVVVLGFAVAPAAALRARPLRAATA